MKHRFEVLDIFRGVFASLVVIFHMRGFADSPLVNNAFMDNADVFVDFFFVLSGFVITYSNENLETETALGEFLKKRFLRIYPLHLVMLISFVLIETFKHYLAGYIHINQPNNPNNNIYSFFTNLFLLNSVKMFGISDVTWNIPSWSISAEAISYLVFGLLVFTLNKFGFKRFRIEGYFLVVVLASLMIYLFTGWFEYLYTFDYGFLRGLIGFFTGALCFVYFREMKEFMGQVRKIIFDVAEPLILVVIAFAVYRSDIFKPLGFVYNSLFFMAVIIFSLERGWLSSLLKRSGFLKKVGTYSYSIYMTHALILSLFNIVFFRLLKMPPDAYTYMLFLNYYIIYKVSGWTYHNIEMRFNRRPEVKPPVISVTAPSQIPFSRP
jgi:peptidoglycan/LPS O-acetylase OafA/YrhL